MFSPSLFYLYIMLDVFSRYVVGWMVSHGERATLAENFIRETCDRQGIGRDQGKKPWQWAQASWIEPKRSGKADRYLSVLNWASE